MNSKIPVVIAAVAIAAIGAAVTFFVKKKDRAY